MRISPPITAVGVLVLSITLSGCEVFKTIGDYFKGSKSEVPAAKSEAPSSAQVPAVVPNAVVSVDDWALGVKDFQERLDALKQVAPDFDVSTVENKRAIVEELINQQVLVREAERMGLADKPEVKAAVEEFRRTVLIRELASKLTEKLSVTDDDAIAFYEEQKEYMTTPVAWRIRAIVVDAKETANQILAAVLNGASFPEQAKAYSKIPGAKENGGDIGFITADQIPFPELANEMLSLGVGDVSKVFQGPDGFYLIKLEEKRGGDPLAFTDVKEEIKSNLLLQRQQELMIERTQEFRQKSRITINEKLL